MIFVDTFYKESRSNCYAIDFIEMYKEMSPETKSSINGKYKVLVSSDEMNYRLTESKKYLSAVNEWKEFISLSSKIRKHPYLEWGIGKGGKIDKISEQIKKFCEKNNIYLYDNPEMSLEVWKKYIQSWGTKISELSNSLKTFTVSDSNTETQNSIISNLNNEIININKALGLEEASNDTGVQPINSIEDAINFMKQSYKTGLNGADAIRELGIDEKNNDIDELSHHFRNSISSVSYTIFRQEKIINEKQKTNQKERSD